MNPERMNSIYQAIYKTSPNTDDGKTLLAVQKLAQSRRAELMAEQRKAAQEMERIRERYSAKTAKEKVDEIETELSVLEQNAKREVMEALHDVIKAKQEQYQRICFKAPTQEHLATLQALALRDDVTEEEVMKLAQQMSDNHQSLRALLSVARKAGLDIHFSFPSDNFEEVIREAQEFFHVMLGGIGTEDRELGYREIEFYNYPGLGFINYFHQTLDQCLHSTVQIEQETPLDRLVKAIEECKESNPEKAKRIAKFIKANEERLMSEDVRLARDIEVLLTKED